MQRKIYYVGWNGKPGTCHHPFLTKKEAIAHGVERDYDGKGIFIIEVPAIVTKLAIKSSRYDKLGTDKGVT